MKYSSEIWNLKSKTWNIQTWNITPETDHLKSKTCNVNLESKPEDNTWNTTGATQETNTGAITATSQALHKTHHKIYTGNNTGATPETTPRLHKGYTRNNTGSTPEPHTRHTSATQHTHTYTHTKAIATQIPSCSVIWANLGCCFGICHLGLGPGKCANGQCIFQIE